MFPYCFAPSGETAYSRGLGRITAKADIPPANGSQINVSLEMAPVLRWALNFDTNFLRAKIRNAFIHLWLALGRFNLVSVMTPVFLFDKTCFHSSVSLLKIGSLDHMVWLLGFSLGLIEPRNLDSCRFCTDCRNRCLIVSTNRLLVFLVQRTQSTISRSSPWG